MEANAECVYTCLSEFDIQFQFVGSHLLSDPERYHHFAVAKSAKEALRSYYDNGIHSNALMPAGHVRVVEIDLEKAKLFNLVVLRKNDGYWLVKSGSALQGSTRSERVALPDSCYKIFKASEVNID